MTSTRVSGVRLFHRFVDDIITVIKKTQSQQLLQHQNNQNARIQFIMEGEANGTLPFMDVRFSMEQQGTLSRQVYQKPTHTNHYLPFTPHYPVSVKSGVVACLASRAITVNSNNALRDKELKRIEKVLIENGYPKQFVTKNIRKQVNSSRKVIARQEEESKLM